jgi:hypothetical protein
MPTSPRYVLHLAPLETEHRYREMALNVAFGIVTDLCILSVLSLCLSNQSVSLGSLEDACSPLTPTEAHYEIYIESSDLTRSYLDIRLPQPRTEWFPAEGIYHTKDAPPTRFDAVSVTSS